MMYHSDDMFSVYESDFDRVAIDMATHYLLHRREITAEQIVRVVDIMPALWDWGCPVDMKVWMFQGGAASRPLEELGKHLPEAYAGWLRARAERELECKGRFSLYAERILDALREDDERSEENDFARYSRHANRLHSLMGRWSARNELLPRGGRKSANCHAGCTRV
jgi:hypothetical protein